MTEALYSSKAQSIDSGQVPVSSCFQCILLLFVIFAIAKKKD